MAILLFDLTKPLFKRKRREKGHLYSLWINPLLLVKYCYMKCGLNSHAAMKYEKGVKHPSLSLRFEEIGG